MLKNSLIYRCVRSKEQARTVKNPAGLGVTANHYVAATNGAAANLVPTQAAIVLILVVRALLDGTQGLQLTQVLLPGTQGLRLTQALLLPGTQELRLTQALLPGIRVLQAVLLNRHPLRIGALQAVLLNRHPLRIGVLQAVLLNRHPLRIGAR